MNKFWAVAVTLISSSAASGQTGTILPEKAARIPFDKKIGSDDGRRILYDYVACTIGKSRSRVEQFLATAPGSTEANKLFPKIVTNSCLFNGSMSFKSSAYRAAAYDVLYHLDFGKDGPVDFSSISPIDYVQRGGGMTADDALAQSALRKLADCAVRHGPAEARHLVLAAAGSRTETIAFGAFTPHLSACMTNDVTMKFSKFTLKAYVGEVLYRLSVAARPAARDN